MDEHTTAGRESERFLREQLITCIGNKRALAPYIIKEISGIRAEIGGRKVSFFDVFSGSGAVSRHARAHASLIVSNDLEDYAALAARTYLANRAAISSPAVIEAHKRVVSSLRRAEDNRFAGLEGFISELYAPRDDANIKPGERAFFTPRNARFLDAAMTLIAREDPGVRDALLAPLVAEASVHANTSGVFKGFHKDRKTGIGRFGGRNADALGRIMKPITLPFPVTSEFDVESLVLQEDAVRACRMAPECDVAYLDPPYNQHPYGSNYFMLNLIATGKRPTAVSPVSGIPHDWRRSVFNRKKDAREAIGSLAESVRARYLIVSFNSEGFVAREDMEAMLARLGKLETREIRYNAFKGSRNLQARSLHVSEYLFVVRRR